MQLHRSLKMNACAFRLTAALWRVASISLACHIQRSIISSVLRDTQWRLLHQLCKFFSIEMASAARVRIYHVAPQKRIHAAIELESESMLPPYEPRLSRCNGVVRQILELRALPHAR